MPTTMQQFQQPPAIPRPPQLETPSFTQQDAQQAFAKNMSRQEFDQGRNPIPADYAADERWP